MASGDAYARVGVDIAAGHRATELMGEAVRSTYGPEVLAGIGAFGGLYDAAALRDMEAPVLVASTDGVGTKTKVAARLGRWDGIGRDLVNHCVNDILVQGARPLFFLDYVASARLDPEQVAAIVAGIAAACREAGCALLGGETAEMPGVYAPGEVDVVGTIIGVVERHQILDGSTVRAGDVVLGMPSTGLHTNGYTLARSLLADMDWSVPHPALEGGTPGEALLAPHRGYVAPVARLRAAGVPLRALAHITGGGLLDNLPRVLPDGLGARLYPAQWPCPPIFTLLAEQGDLHGDDLYRTFNMGLGMLVVVPPDEAARALDALPGALYRAGAIVAGSGVEIVGAP